MNTRFLRNCRFLLILAIVAFSGAWSNAQTYSVIHNFNEVDGCCTIYPNMMAQGEDGNIYGTTLSGGSHFYGNIFMITPAGAITDLHDFSGADGIGPQGGVTLGVDGNLYGTTYEGGSGHGTIFKFSPTAGFLSLYSFASNGDGAYPRTAPVQAMDGNLYGVTGNGTQYALYKLTTSGVFSVVATMPSYSYSPLLLGTDGNLYGTTLYGGTYNAGTVFQFVPGSKTLKTLHSFNTEWGAAGPLIQGADGFLYGTAGTGGTGSSGAIYRISTTGSYKVIYNFSTAGTNDGRNPQSGVVQGSDGFLYGVATTGGANGLGTLFKVSTTGTNFALLHSFDTPTGDTPGSALLLHTNGTIYGQTEHGGTDVPYGVIFSFTNNLHPFAKPLISVAAKVGASVGLLGQGFTSASAVDFGSTPGSKTVTIDTYMTAKPAAGSTTAQITVKEPTGNLVSPLKFRIVPSIKSFSPPSGPVGTVVTITGMSFSQMKSVKFGGVAATSVVVNSDTQVTATVPTGAVTGPIVVITAGGSAVSATPFTVQ